MARWKSKPKKPPLLSTARRPPVGAISQAPSQTVLASPPIPPPTPRDTSAVAAGPERSTCHAIDECWLYTCYIIQRERERDLFCATFWY